MAGRFAKGGVIIAAALVVAGPAIAASGFAAPNSNGAPVDEPLLTAAEQAVIERKCGDGGDERITLEDGALVCSDGRRFDDPETRAIVAALKPRIASLLKPLEELTDGTLERSMHAVREALASLSKR